jgi:hypothetical protein
VRYYLSAGAVRIYGGPVRIREISVLRKPLATGKPIILPNSFHQVERVRVDRLTLNTYASKHPVTIWFPTLQDLPTGFGEDAVLIDGPSP